MDTACGFLVLGVSESMMADWNSQDMASIGWVEAASLKAALMEDHSIVTSVCQTANSLQCCFESSYTHHLLPPRNSYIHRLANDQQTPSTSSQYIRLR